MPEQGVDYSLPVYRCLMQRDLIAGVSKLTLAVILGVPGFLVMAFSLWWLAIPALPSYLVLRHLTKNDPYIVETILESLMQPDHLYP